MVLGLGTGIRFHGIQAQSLWYDEGNTAHMTLRSPWNIVTAATGDIHPPGYYLALTGWSKMVGRSEFSLRAMSAFAGIVLLGVLYRLGSDYGGTNVGLLSALMGAVHGALVYYSQEARMYMVAATLGGVIVLLSTRMALRMVLLRKRTYCYSYIIVAAAGLYTHYSFSFILIGANAAVLWHLMRAGKGYARSSIGAWCRLQLAVLLLYSPWMPIAITQVTQWPATSTQSALGSTVIDMWHWLALGPTIELVEGLPATIVIAMLTVIGLLSGLPIMIAMWLIAPAALMLALGLFGESFAKFLLLNVPAVILLAAAGCGAIIRKGKLLVLLVSCPLLIVAVWYIGISLVNLYTDRQYFRDDYRGIAAKLSERDQSTNAILLIAPNQIEVLSYYYPVMKHVYPIARSRPFDVRDQRAQLVNLTAQYRRLTALYWGDGQADPEMVVESWLNENTFRTSSEWYGKVRVVDYSIADVTRSRRTERVGKIFGDVIELVSYEIGEGSYAAGDVVDVLLSWVAVSDIKDEYSVFVHVYSDERLPPVAQHDSQPAGGGAPTVQWRVGEEVPDRHGVRLPGNITPGLYSLGVGLYKPGDAIRVDVDGEGATDGRLVLNNIIVVD